MTRTGRNDPCPCGSGKKYKKCCLGLESTLSAEEPVGEIAARLAMQILEWAEDRHPQVVDTLRRRTTRAFGTGDEMLGFVVPLLAFAGGPGTGERFSVLFGESRRHHLAYEERAILDAEIDAWHGIWEVQEVLPGEGLRLVDLLSGEERGVRERSASESLEVRNTILAAVVRVGAGWQLSGMYPYSLLPADAATVVQAFRKVRKSRTRHVPIPELQGESAFRLGELWAQAVEAQMNKPLPAMQNMDGDPLEPTTDRYAFPPEAREGVVRALLALEGADDDTDDSAKDRGETIVGLMRPVKNQPAAHDAMVVAQFVVRDTELVVETNSRKRADTACGLLEGSSAGSTVVRGERTHQSIEEMMAALPQAEDGAAEETSISPEENAGLIRAMKERHYDAWPDDPIPALGGMTPRKAAQDRRKREYRALDLLLRDMEGHEQRHPEAERYDFAALRDRLGMPP